MLPRAPRSSRRSYQDTGSQRSRAHGGGNAEKASTVRMKVLSLWSLVIGVAVHFFIAA